MDKLSNQVRFIQMIIKKELTVSGRKKAEVVRELKAKGFTAYPKVVKVKEDDAEPTEEQDEDDTPGTTDYDYLLQVYIHNEDD